MARGFVCLVALSIVSAGLFVAQSTPPVRARELSNVLLFTLPMPTDIVFAPDGRMVIAALDGRVWVADGGVPFVALDPRERVCFDINRGLGGAAIDPEYETNGFIYLLYTFRKHGGCDLTGERTPVNRLSRFVLSRESAIDPASEMVLLDNIPSIGGEHNGGALGFGPDGYLYVGQGDAGCDVDDHEVCHPLNDNARSLSMLTGKILRITRDGGVPPDNPFLGPDSAPCALTGGTSAGTVCQEIFATGVRNPWRLSFDPMSAEPRFFFNDVGESDWEEINEGRSGADYGWNLREGSCAVGSRTECGPPPEGLTDPIHSYVHSGCGAITGGAFVPPGVLGAGRSSGYVFADLRCGYLWRLDPSGDDYRRRRIGEDLGAVVSLTLGPDNALYAIVYNGGAGEIRRLALDEAA